MPRSAPYTIFKGVIAFLVFGFLFTLLRPFWSAILGSGFYEFQTKWGQNYGAWQQGIFDWFGLILLIGILIYGFVASRRATT